ncbi:MAG TPA: hypothetical protein VN842_01880 [Thermoplasmata archaeon]|nr:hypothetical protein [Thermoplasmata archaeon]
MAFLESNGVHYRACCDECGTIGPLGETTTIAAKAAVKLLDWVSSTPERLVCGDCAAKPKRSSPRRLSP